MRPTSALLALGLALSSCSGGDPARARVEAAERAERDAEESEVQRRLTEVAAGVKQSLDKLGARPVADAVEKACEAALNAKALKVEPQVAEACSRAYLELAERNIRKGESGSASLYLELQQLTGIQSQEVDAAQQKLATLREKEHSKRVAAKEAEARRVVSRADPADWRQAQEFLAALPAACGGSKASVATDGSVLIHLRCTGGQQSMDGSVRIKDGIITEIR